MKSTRYVVYAAVIAALYFVMVMMLAPISFGVVQFRAANILKALALARPEFAFGFGLGNFFANQGSPFGALDWAIMPFFDIAGALAAYRLRRVKWVAVFAQSFIIALGVATFPLGVGARLPWALSFGSVLLSTLLAISLGVLILLPAYNAYQKRT